MIATTYLHFFLLNSMNIFFQCSCWSTLILIVGKKILWKSLWTSNCLVFHVLQNSIYVQQKKETHSGFFWVSKWWYKNKTMKIENCHTMRIDRQMTTIPLTLIKQQNTKRKIPHYSWLKNFNTVALGISLYSVLFLYLLIQFLECFC